MAPSKMLQILMPKPFVDSTRIELYADSIRTSYCKLERQYDIRIKVEGVDTSKLLQEVLLIPTKKLRFKQLQFH
jgi:hypothetical protein